MRLQRLPGREVPRAQLGACRELIDEEGIHAVAGRRVGMIVSGGNVDLDRLPWTRA